MTFFEKLKQERIIPVVKIQDAAKRRRWPARCWTAASP